MKLFSKYCLIIGIWLLIITLNPTPTFASVGLSVTPPVTEVLLSPNKTMTTTITLKNTGDDLHYSASIHKLIPTDDQGHSTIDPTPLNLDQLPLIPTLVGQEFDTPYPLSASQTTNLTLSLESASLDTTTDLYLALVIRPVDPSNSSLTSSTTPAISALILTSITPVPAIPTDISLQNFTPPTIFDSALPLTLNPIAKNNAAIMLRVEGIATLTSPSGKVLSETKQNPTLILGNTSRNLSPLVYNFSIFDFGPHRISYILKTEGGRSLLETSNVVWILPLRAILTVIIGIIILTIIKIRYYRLTATVK